MLKNDMYNIIIILKLFVIVDMKTNIKMFDFKFLAVHFQIHTLIETLLCLQIYGY